MSHVEPVSHRHIRRMQALATDLLKNCINVSTLFSSCSVDNRPPREISSILIIEIYIATSFEFKLFTCASVDARDWQHSLCCTSNCRRCRFDVSKFSSYPLLVDSKVCSIWVALSSASVLEFFSSLKSTSCKIFTCCKISYFSEQEKINSV